MHFILSLYFLKHIWKLLWHLRILYLILFLPFFQSELLMNSFKVWLFKFFFLSQILWFILGLLSIHFVCLLHVLSSLGFMNIEVCCFLNCFLQIVGFWNLSRIEEDCLWIYLKGISKVGNVSSQRCVKVRSIVSYLWFCIIL